MKLLILSLNMLAIMLFSETSRCAFIIFKKGAHCYGRSFDGITADGLCRIVIDKNGQPLVYMRHIYGESINIEHVKGEFDEDGWLKVVGMMGTDDGKKEWMTRSR